MTLPTVYAAGVVLVGNDQRFLVVHRALRQDWSLPKGKLESGEHRLAAAVRECDEETGYVPILGPHLATETYEAFGAPKVVDYWVARVGSLETFTPDEEVDEIRWVTLGEAQSLLTYPRDLDIAAQGISAPKTSPLIILRHTKAQSRSSFNGHVDSERPLSGKGRSQSKLLVPLLAAYGITEVHSSTSTRCAETVQRFANSIGTSIEKHPRLSEEGHEKSTDDAAGRTLELLERPASLVVCSHRPVLPTIISAVAARLGLNGDDPNLDPKLPPGGFIVIHRVFATDGSISVAGVERHTL